MTIKLNSACEARATKAAAFIAGRIDEEGDLTGTRPRVAILFTTGLQQYFPFDTRSPLITPYTKIPGFEDLDELEEVPGHVRRVVIRFFEGTSIVELRGRLHLNEGPDFAASVRRMVRLQFDMLAHLGVEILIVTSAVGSCTSCLRIGQIGVAEHFLFGSSGSYTGYEGEFVGIEDALCPRLSDIALQKGSGDGPLAVPVTHAFVRGPTLESPQMKRNIARDGGHIVGMSMQPAAEAFARQGKRVLCLGMVTNGFEHSHDDVVAICQDKGPVWMEYLADVTREIIVTQLSGP